MIARPAILAVTALVLLLTGCATASPPPTAPAAITLPSISYTISKSGPADGAQPTRKDTVLVNYDVRLTDGTLVDSSYERGEPSRFPLPKLIPAQPLPPAQADPGLAGDRADDAPRRRLEGHRAFAVRLRLEGSRRDPGQQHPDLPHRVAVVRASD